MGRLLTAVIDYLDELSWHYQVAEDKQRVLLGVLVADQRLDVMIVVSEERDFIMCLTVLPVLIPAGRRLAIAELICRANYGLNYGNFEMDFVDGELRCRTTINTDTLSMIPLKHIHILLHSNIHLMGRYIPAIMAVTYAGISAAEAIAKVEGGGFDYFLN
jgi:hypothetical protein